MSLSQQVIASAAILAECQALRSSYSSPPDKKCLCTSAGVALNEKDRAALSQRLAISFALKGFVGVAGDVAAAERLSAHKNVVLFLSEARNIIAERTKAVSQTVFFIKTLFIHGSFFIFFFRGPLAVFTHLLM